MRLVLRTTSRWSHPESIASRGLLALFSLVVLFAVGLDGTTVRADESEVQIELSVIGFDVDEGVRKQLEEMASAGQGKYYPAGSEADLVSALSDASGAPPKTPTPDAGAGTKTACGHALSASLFAKWRELGGEQGVLGCPVTDESDAQPSPQRTAGRLAKFGGKAGGLIALHGSGERAGKAFEIHGCIFGLYEKLGGTSSWLGFPVSDVFVTQGGLRADFEAGYITWGEGPEGCKEHRHGAAAER